eukprot:gene51214-10021_t
MLQHGDKFDESWAYDELRRIGGHPRRADGDALDEAARGYRKER